MPREDLLVGPEGCKELTHIWYHAKALQVTDDAAAVYCVTSLHQIEEYEEEGVLVESGKVLGYIELYYPCVQCCLEPATEKYLKLSF